MLAFEQMMERQRLGGAIGAGIWLIEKLSSLVRHMAYLPATTAVGLTPSRAL